MRLDFNDLCNDQSGKIYGSHLSGHIGTFYQEGDIDWDKGAITIDHFRETSSAKDSLRDISISGERATFAGMMRAKGVYFDYNNSVEFEETAHAELDNTRFKTGHFLTKGNLFYQKHLVIDANKTDFLAGSQTTGAVSDKPKSEPTTNANGENKDLDPITSTHVLLVNSDSVLIDAKLSGGDYTQISGLPDETKNDNGVVGIRKCDSVIIGEKADIDLTHGAIATAKSDISGQTKLSEFNIQMDAAELNQNSALSLKKSVYGGNELKSNGTFNLDNALVNIDQIKLSNLAQETINDSTINAKNLSDNSQLNYQGQAVFIVDRYEHGGRIAVILPPSDIKNNNIFYVKSNSVNLHGSGDLDQAYYDIQHLIDAIITLVIV
jgi:hypothetical protein